MGVNNYAARQKRVVGPRHHVDDRIADTQNVEPNFSHYWLPLFGRMRPHRRLVDLYTRTRPGEQHQFASLDRRGVDEQLVPPGNAVDVDFYDSEVGRSRVEMRADGGAEAAVINLNPYP